MKIKINEIPEEGLEINFTEKPEAFDFEDKELFLFPVDLNAKVTKLEENLFVKGTLRTKIRLECCRCIIKFDFNLESIFDIIYVPSSSIRENEEDLELTRYDLDVNYYEGDSLELFEFVRQQLVLDIPLKPLCKDDCLGLCFSCGINRNIQECHCEKDNIDPRLSELSNLLKNNKRREN